MPQKNVHGSRKKGSHSQNEQFIEDTPLGRGITPESRHPLTSYVDYHREDQREAHADVQRDGLPGAGNWGW